MPRAIQAVFWIGLGMLAVAALGGTVLAFQHSVANGFAMLAVIGSVLVTGSILAATD
jgi:hypothetical protein